MKKLKLNMNKKNIIMMIGAIVGFVLIVVIALLLITRGGSQEKKLKSRMEELGKDFYENFYYKQVGSTDEEKVAFLKKYESIGIKVNLDNLARYNTKENSKILEEFVNNKTKKECDKNNSQIIIYPKDPYNQTSYKIEVKLDCGFKEESK